MLFYQLLTQAPHHRFLFSRAFKNQSSIAAIVWLPASPRTILRDSSMKPRTSNTAHATIRWVGSKEFRPPWLRYNPTILVDSIPDLDMTSACWDIVVREITPCSTDRTFDVTFQFASPRAPHGLLAAGLDFDLCEGPGICVWRGTVHDTFVATRNPDDWYVENRDS